MSMHFIHFSHGVQRFESCDCPESSSLPSVEKLRYKNGVARNVAPKIIPARRTEVNSDKIITSKNKKTFDNPMIDELKKSETYRKTMEKNSLSSVESRPSKSTLDGDVSPKIFVIRFFTKNMSSICPKVA